MKIIWLTDLHLSEPGKAFPAGVDPVARTRACLEDAFAHHADADRLVITGDLVQLGNHSAYRILADLLREAPMPVRLLAGNHDDRVALFATFPDIGRQDGFAQSAEMCGGFQLIYLDTIAADGKHYGELCETRLSWLRDTLDRADAPALVFMHHPPFDVGIPALDALRLLESDRLADMLGNGAVRQILCGHLHRSVSGSWHGTPMAVMKSPHVQFDLDMGAGKLSRSDESPGYGIILAEDDQIVVHLRDLSQTAV